MAVMKALVGSLTIEMETWREGRKDRQVVTEARTETEQEPREAKSKTDLEEMDTTDLEANPENLEAAAVHQRLQWWLLGHWRTDLWSNNL
jgi:hypothetical protein